jgi:glucose-fructose oxidoreductase
VQDTFAYQDLDECLSRVDAVYIALPNSMHAEFAVRAAEAGVHVLCEKPMAVTVADCERMIAAAREHDVRLMIAYRLHFEHVNLKAVGILKDGGIGDAKLFNSTFSMRVRPGDIRTQRVLGGGTLFDIGIYCVNAARSLPGRAHRSARVFSERGSVPTPRDRRDHIGDPAFRWWARGEFCQ